MVCCLRHLERRVGLWRSATGLVFLLLICGGQLCAKTVSISGLGRAVNLAHDTWSYQQGDDLAFKEAAFDDSAWRTMIPAKLSPDDFKCLGICWYRIRLQVPNDVRGLSLALNNVDTSYEVFVNGERIGGHGRMPPHSSNYTSNLTIYPVPDKQVATGNVTVAVRVWVSKLQNTNEPPGGVNAGSEFLFGETSVLELSRQRDVSYSVYPRHVARHARIGSRLRGPVSVPQPTAAH